MLLTLSLLNDPYPNNEVMISSDASIKATAAGTDKNKHNSRALFCKLLISLALLFFTYFDN